MTASEFLACCISRGLTVADIDEMNLGMIIDYIYAYDEIRYGVNENSQSDDVAVMASQADFDVF